MTALRPPGDRSASTTLVSAALLTAVPAGLAVTAVVALTPASVRGPLIAGGSAVAILLSMAVAVATHARQTARALSRRLDSLTEDTGRLLHERARLTEELERERERTADRLSTEDSRLRSELERERARSATELERERAQLAESFATERARLTESFEAERESFAAELAKLAEENTRLAAEARTANTERASALAATANAAGRMQALATGTLADLRAMEQKHGDEEVLGDLLHLDHRTAQAGRLADSVAVLAGARSGRRWARPIGMESILRGAMGRISGYQRVRVHSVSDTAVAGHAAEGVMHAVAELLDNAANFSPPTAEVHVYVEEVPAGVIVSVEDSGLVMGEVQLRRAEKAVTGENTGGLGGLTGTRLGLTVVGRLARKYGLKVSFRPSARGGTGVLVLVPQDLLVGPRAGDRPTVLPRTATPRAEGPRTEGPRTKAPLADGPRRSVTPGPDPEPVPTHESADRGDMAGRGATREDASHQDAARGDASRDRGTGTGTGTATDGEAVPGLPRRRRGRTYAEAERTRVRPAERPAATPADARTRVARFSSFRQAVRGTADSGPEATGTTDTGTTDTGTTGTGTTDTAGAEDPAKATTRAVEPATTGTDAHGLGPDWAARETGGQDEQDGQDDGVRAETTTGHGAKAPAGDNDRPGDNDDAVSSSTAAAATVARSPLATPEGGTTS